MKKEFKAGDLVFEVSANQGVHLSKIEGRKDSYCELETENGSYTTDGRICVSNRLSSLFYATPENRQALVALYGEDAVPKLPLRGSELAIKLLENQRYVIASVSDVSDEDARECCNNQLLFNVNQYVKFEDVMGGAYRFAVPVDNNGNEITELED